MDVATTIIAILNHIFLMIVTMEINIAISIPMMGAKNMKSIVLIMVSLSTILVQDTLMPLSRIPCMIAAPAKPPMSVCEDEEGIPNHQVNRFQKIAAIKPDKITGRVINSLNTVLLMVFATA